MRLLFDDLQDLHGANLCTDAAGDALAGGTLSGSDHDLHGADLHTLTAGSAELLVDHIHAGLGILGDSTSLTNLGTLTALDAGHRLCCAVLVHNTDARQILVKFLIESLGASLHTFQTSHALSALLNHQFLHERNLLFPLLQRYYTVHKRK